MIRRREFIAGLGSLGAWPLAARAQQTAMPVVGFLHSGSPDTVAQANLAAFREALKTLGWIEDVNVRLDIRYGGGDPNRLGLQAEELVRGFPDVIVVAARPAQRAVLRQTQTIPIVMATGADPVPAGVVERVARPGGNVTGFVALVSSIGGKWVELLKLVAPHVGRIALLYPDFENDVGSASATYFASIEAAATQLGVQSIRTPVSKTSEIEPRIDAFATEPNGGLIILPPPLVAHDREIIIRRAAQHKLPAIFFNRSDVLEGGLFSYGSNIVDLYRNAASYVDRILRGARVGELPLQFPTKYQLVINLKTAKALGVTIPEALLATADEVIQ
jgi:putative ABC transport system substrate-binding protein